MTPQTGNSLWGYDVMKLSKNVTILSCLFGTVQPVVKFDCSEDGVCRERVVMTTLSLEPRGSIAALPT
jgi:hypothetical protein